MGMFDALSLLLQSLFIDAGFNFASGQCGLQQDSGSLVQPFLHFNGTYLRTCCRAVRELPLCIPFLASSTYQMLRGAMMACDALDLHAEDPTWLNTHFTGDSNLT